MLVAMAKSTRAIIHCFPIPAATVLDRNSESLQVGCIDFHSKQLKLLGRAE